jgi:SAM-dependent methyltransferase
MNEEIIGLHRWFQTPPGRYMLAWEREQLGQAVSDIFGFHALQLGMPEIDALCTNRMPHRWLAHHIPTSGASLLTDFSALPFPASSLDLVVLPHSLELSPDPHTTLREVERVLVPEGRVVICGLNPASLWGLRQRRAHLYHRMGFGHMFLPQAGEFIGHRRLRDWLRLLGFEVEVLRFGCYRPALASDKWLQRFAWMDVAGARLWPILGAAYFVVAVKRVRGMTLLNPGWKAARAMATAPAPVANRSLVNVLESQDDRK